MIKDCGSPGVNVAPARVSPGAVPRVSTNGRRSPPAVVGISESDRLTVQKGLFPMMVCHKHGTCLQRRFPLPHFFINGLVKHPVVGVNVSLEDTSADSGLRVPDCFVKARVVLPQNPDRVPAPRRVQPRGLQSCGTGFTPSVLLSLGIWLDLV